MSSTKSALSKDKKLQMIISQPSPAAPRLPPETIHAIVHDFTTRDLYRCLLVDRYWCSNVVSLLWQDPFMNATDNSRLVVTYLAFLSPDERKQLSDDGVYVPPLRPPPTFVYPAFLKTMNYLNLGKCVTSWLKSVQPVDNSRFWGGMNNEEDCSIDLYPKVEINSRQQKSALKQAEIGSITHRSAVKRAIVKMLLRSAQGVSKLILDSPDDYLLLGPEEVVKWISRFQELETYSYPLEYDKYIVLCQGCQNLGTLRINLRFERPDWTREGAGEIKKLANFLQLQRKLHHFLLKTSSNRWVTGVAQLIKQLPRTLRHLAFESVNFTGITSLEPLTRLEALETLTFKDCYMLPEGVCNPLINGQWKRLRRVQVTGKDICKEVKHWATRINSST